MVIWNPPTQPLRKISLIFFNNKTKQAGAELGQAQVQLEVVDEVLVEVVALVVVEVGVHYFFGQVGGWVC